jgi:hypothetical protein
MTGGETKVREGRGRGGEAKGERTGRKKEERREGKGKRGGKGRGGRETLDSPPPQPTALDPPLKGIGCTIQLLVCKISFDGSSRRS